MLSSHIILPWVYIYDMTALPTNLSRPAQRALASAGYTTLEEVAELPASELLSLHGFGPKGIAILRQACAEHGIKTRL